jgi:hypothetical protein
MVFMWKSNGLQDKTRSTGSAGSHVPQMLAIISRQMDRQRKVRLEIGLLSNLEEMRIEYYSSIDSITTGFFSAFAAQSSNEPSDILAIRGDWRMHTS